MAATLRIDTLKFVRKLTDAGMDRLVAEAIVEGLSGSRHFRACNEGRLVASRRLLPIAELKAEIFRFMLLQAVGIIGLTVTLIKLLP